MIGSFTLIFLFFLTVLFLYWVTLPINFFRNNTKKDQYLNVLQEITNRTEISSMDIRRNIEEG